jgi:hypothetical protein
MPSNTEMPVVDPLALTNPRRQPLQSILDLGHNPVNMPHPIRVSAIRLLIAESLDQGLVAGRLVCVWLKWPATEAIPGVGLHADAADI